MWAALAAFAFLLALIFHAAAGSVLQYWVDAELIGLGFLAVHMIWPSYPWRRSGPPR